MYISLSSNIVSDGVILSEHFFVAALRVFGCELASILRVCDKSVHVLDVCLRQVTLKALEPSELHELAWHHLEKVRRVSLLNLVLIEGAVAEANRLLRVVVASSDRTKLG